MKLWRFHVAWAIFAVVPFLKFFKPEKDMSGFIASGLCFLALGMIRERSDTA